MSALPNENVVFLDDSQDAVISVLTNMLNRARAGEITFLTCAYLTSDGGVGSSRAGIVDCVNDAYMIVGGLEGVKHSVLAEMERISTASDEGFAG